eukprot:m.458376 g.458376  ORF g.458376 m.458376 type:complete len:147 (+) comp56990_c0_seq8:156-596(+)
MESAPAEHTPLTSGRVRVCIIGGGYGGRQAARKLPRAQFDVTLIDRKPYFEHIIGVYHCAVEPRNYARCRLDLARALPHVRLVIGEIASVDRTCTKMLNGTTIPFDYLPAGAATARKRICTMHCPSPTDAYWRRTRPASRRHQRSV